jgi:hypothetical protein
MGIRYRLDHQRGSDDPLVYRGVIAGDIECDVEVLVTASGAEARAVDAPSDRRADLERTAAVMVRSAVRRAEREGLPPPRRIERWRDR